MKRALATMALVVGVGVVAVPAATAASAAVPSDRCIYTTVRNTSLYENKQGEVNDRDAMFQAVFKGTTVAGPCGSSRGWTPITHIYAFNKWNAVHSFENDKDYMRTTHLDYRYHS